MTALTLLRIVNIAIWAVLFLYVAVGAGHAISGKNVRRSDPWRLSVAAVSLFIVLGNLRWLLAPDNDQLFQALYVMGAVVGLYKLHLARTYGRGPRL